MLKTAHKYTFEDFLKKSSEAKGLDDLFSLLSKAAGSYGYDRVIFSVARDNDLPENFNRIGLAQNYPEDWQKYYVEKDYSRIDPVLKFAAIADTPFTWSGLEKSVNFSKKQTKFMREGEEAGLFNGVGIPIKMGNGQFAGVALATSEKVDACQLEIDLLNAFCQQFYLVFKRLHETDSPNWTMLPSLTPKEEEVLKWAASGKSDEEIGIILNMSRHTADMHFRKIYNKLSVNSRIQAVVKAIMCGLIKI